MRYAVLALVQIGLAVYCIVDISNATERRPRGIAKAAWYLMVVFLPFIGGIAWILLKWREGRGGSGARPPRAPDDDPDYLRWLAQRRRRRGDET